MKNSVTGNTFAYENLKANSAAQKARVTEYLLANPTKPETVELKQDDPKDPGVIAINFANMLNDSNIFNTEYKKIMSESVLSTQEAADRDRGIDWIVDKENDSLIRDARGKGSLSKDELQSFVAEDLERADYNNYLTIAMSNVRAVLSRLEYRLQYGHITEEQAQTARGAIREKFETYNATVQKLKKNEKVAEGDGLADIDPKGFMKEIGGIVAEYGVPDEKLNKAKISNGTYEQSFHITTLGEAAMEEGKDPSGIAQTNIKLTDLTPVQEAQYQALADIPLWDKDILLTVEAVNAKLEVMGVEDRVEESDLAWFNNKDHEDRSMVAFDMAKNILNGSTIPTQALDFVIGIRNASKETTEVLEIKDGNVEYKLASEGIRHGTLSHNSKKVSYEENLKITKGTVEQLMQFNNGKPMHITITNTPENPAERAFVKLVEAAAEELGCKTSILQFNKIGQLALPNTKSVREDLAVFAEGLRELSRPMMNQLYEDIARDEVKVEGGVEIRETGLDLDATDLIDFDRISDYLEGKPGVKYQEVKGMIHKVLDHEEVGPKLDQKTRDMYLVIENAIEARHLVNNVGLFKSSENNYNLQIATHMNRINTAIHNEEGAINKYIDTLKIDPAEKAEIQEKFEKIQTGSLQCKSGKDRTGAAFISFAYAGINVTLTGKNLDFDNVNEVQQQGMAALALAYHTQTLASLNGGTEGNNGVKTETAPALAKSFGDRMKEIVVRAVGSFNKFSDSEHRQQANEVNKSNIKTANENAKAAKAAEAQALKDMIAEAETDMLRQEYYHEFGDQSTLDPKLKKQFDEELYEMFKQYRNDEIDEKTLKSKISQDRFKAFKELKESKEDEKLYMEEMPAKEYDSNEKENQAKAEEACEAAKDARAEQARIQNEQSIQKQADRYAEVANRKQEFKQGSGYIPPSLQHVLKEEMLAKIQKEQEEKNEKQNATDNHWKHGEKYKQKEPEASPPSPLDKDPDIQQTAEKLKGEVTVEDLASNQKFTTGTDRVNEIKRKQMEERKNDKVGRE